jgi:hypothetical protein
MRFDSIAGLQQLIMMFNYLGYLCSSIDFENDMKKSGMNLHISRYTAKISADIKNDAIYICFYYYGNMAYKVTLSKVYEQAK